MIIFGFDKITFGRTFCLFAFCYELIFLVALFLTWLLTLLVIWVTVQKGISMHLFRPVKSMRARNWELCSSEFALLLSDMALLILDK